MHLITHSGPKKINKGKNPECNDIKGDNRFVFGK